jgi:cell division inhibitor SepF
MAGAMRKMAVYLGLVEDEDLEGSYDDGTDEDLDGYDERTHVVRRHDEPTLRVTRPDEAPERGSSARREPVNALDAYRITTVHPRNYNEARVIGEHFRDGTPVIMNLTEMDDADAKRLVDFSAGLVFGRHGSIERVTAKVFLLTPDNVEITAEDKSRIVGAGFFNQS